jgi:uncharacterized protein
MTDVPAAPQPGDNDYTEIYQDPNGGWRWRRKAGNHEVIASSEAYTRKEDAERSARRVFGLAKDAPLVRRAALAAGRVVRDFLGRPVP